MVYPKNQCGYAEPDSKTGTNKIEVIQNPNASQPFNVREPSEGMAMEAKHWNSLSLFMPIIVPTTDKAFARTDIFLNVERMYFSSSENTKKTERTKKKL